MSPDHPSKPPHPRIAHILEPKASYTSLSPAPPPQVPAPTLRPTSRTATSPPTPSMTWRCCAASLPTRPPAPVTTPAGSHTACRQESNATNYLCIPVEWFTYPASPIPYTQTIPGHLPLTPASSCALQGYYPRIEYFYVRDDDPSLTMHRLRDDQTGR
jgi:hypothetical protein